MTLAYSNVGFTAPANTIVPEQHGGAVNGLAVDLAGFSGAHFEINVGAGLAAPVTFTFQDSANGTDGWTTMSCADMCADPVNLTHVISQLDADYSNTRGKICLISMCCPRRYVRAISSAGGDYAVTVVRYGGIRFPV